MTDNTIARRQALLRQRERERGLKRRTVTIPIERDQELTDTVAEWMRIKNSVTSSDQ